MKAFKDLQARHEELTNKVQAKENVLVEAQDLIAEINRESSHITSLNERDQLRANLRFWASYVYEISGNYPNVDLSPASVSPQSRWLSPSTLGVAVVILFLLIISFFMRNQQESSSPTATQVLSTTKPINTGESISTPITPSSTPILDSPSPTNTQKPPTGAIAIEITSVRDGDEVSPITTLRGIYSNLPFGYSIHVIVQPLSKSGRLYPMKQFASVSPNSSTGIWEIETWFGKGSDLKEKEAYQIQLVAAINDDARQKLLDAVEFGMDELPASVIPFPQKITVDRASSTDFISEERLVFSSFLDDEGNYEIFTTKTDGSDIRRITYSSGFNEYYPSISPDGMMIAYVGRRTDENKHIVQSIDVMNSDGTEVKTIVQNQQNLTYENPLWSSDGRYIAYAVGTPRENNPLAWNIYVFDRQEDKGFKITSGDTTSNRYFSWIPNTFEIVFDSRIPQTGTSGFMKIDIRNPEATSIYFDESKEELQPAVSPNGKLLAYVQLDARTGNIYVVDLSTKNVVQLTTGDFFDSHPTWSLDGKTIFFDTAETAFITVWSVNVDGSDLTQLTFGKDRYPSAGVMYALIPK